MKFREGDMLVGGTTTSGMPYTGTVEKVNREKNKVFVRWTYVEGDKDRVAWYPVIWIKNYILEKNLTIQSGIVRPEVRLDEELFTL